MPLFQYQALDQAGKRKSGLLEAQDEREVKAKLREMGIMVISITPKTSVATRQNLKGDNLLAFTHQLSQLVNAGIPLYESLVAIEEQCRGESYHRIILSLCEQIKGGASLSQAMSTYPESFNKLYCSMIMAGESVGVLNVVLDKLTLLLTRQNKLKGEITTALVYPAVLASFSFLIIIMLLTFVVPSIEGIFAERKLNGFTQFVLNVSHVFRAYWWLYLPIVIGTITFLFIKIRSPAGRIWMERHLLKVPMVRTLMIQTAVARFCRTMGTLQQGGLPMIDSLRISRDVMRNVVLEEDVKRAEMRIIEGSSLGYELGQSKYIPTLVSRMLIVGEDSGSNVTMLNTVADLYEGEVEKTLNRIMALAQPVILIFMGTVIGAVLLAILLPLTDVSSLSM
ncbi:MAG: type II secretion system F family protein [Parachlamydiaceae bacterium]|nr:type II secretion system F family protein [Parachlamydiaceae bacterium]